MNEPTQPSEAADGRSDSTEVLGKTLRHISIKMEMLEGNILDVEARIQALHKRVIEIDSDATDIRIQCGRYYDQWHLFYYSSLGVTGKLNIA